MAHIHNLSKAAKMKCSKMKLIKLSISIVNLLWNVKVQQKGEKSNMKKKHALIACTLMREEKMDQPIAILEIRGGLIIER